MELFSALTSFSISLLLLLAAPHCMKRFWEIGPLHKYISVFFITFTGALFLTTLAFSVPVLNSAILLRTSQAMLGTGVATFFIISFIFPENRATFPVRDALLLMSPALIISTLALFTDFSISGASFEGHSLQIDIGDLYKYYNIIIFNYVVLGLLNLAMKYFRHTDPVIKRNIMTILLGALGALFLALLIPFALPKLFSGLSIDLLGPALGIICIIVSFSLALRLPIQFDTKNIISSSKTSSALAIVLFIPVYGLTALHELEIPGPAPSLAVAVVITAVFLLVYTIASSFREDTLPENACPVNELTRSANFDELYQKSNDYLTSILGYKKIFITRYNRDNNSLDAVREEGTEMLLLPSSESMPLAGWFSQKRQIIHSESLPNQIQTDCKLFEYIEEFIAKNHLSALIPVYFREDFAGLIGVSGKPYSEFRAGDLRDLDTFQHAYNIIFANFLRLEKIPIIHETTDAHDFVSGTLSHALPQSLPNMKNIKFGSFYLMHHDDEGNFFDFLRPGINSIGIVATDLTGHGIDRALYAVLLRASFQSCLPGAAETDATMQRVNSSFCTFKGESNILIPAWYSYYNTDTGQLSYTNAGFAPLQLYRAATNKFEILGTESVSLGSDKGYQYSRETTGLSSGDIGFLFSHDLIRIQNNQGEEFGIQRLRKAVQRRRESNPSEITEAVYNTLSAFAEQLPSNSDAYMILFKIE